MNLLKALLMAVLIFLPGYAQAQEVCLSEKDIVEIVTLLDSYERDLDVFKDCKTLAESMQKHNEESVKIIEDLTKRLVAEKQKNLSYEKSIRRWKTVSFSAGGVAVVLFFITVL